MTDFLHKNKQLRKTGIKHKICVSISLQILFETSYVPVRETASDARKNSCKSSRKMSLTVVRFNPKVKRVDKYLL
jgi:hypothetical protein